MQQQYAFTGEQIIKSIVFTHAYMLKNNKATTRKTHNASFLSKLQNILSEPELNPIIRWNTDGTAIQIISISRLEQHILPLYFRHSKYTSFVRQLNIYGFSKSKTEKGLAAAFSHPIFVQGFTELQKISKKNPKQTKKDESSEDNGSPGEERILLEHPRYTDPVIPQIQQGSADHKINLQTKNLQNQEFMPSNPEKNPSQSKQMGGLSHQEVTIQQNIQSLSNPSVTKLIQELDAKISSFDFQIDILQAIEIQCLLRESRYEKVRYIYQDRWNLEGQWQQSNSQWEISEIMEEQQSHKRTINRYGMQSSQMEFIL